MKEAGCCVGLNNALVIPILQFPFLTTLFLKNIDALDTPKGVSERFPFAIYELTLRRKTGNVWVSKRV